MFAIHSIKWMTLLLTIYFTSLSWEICNGYITKKCKVIKTLMNLKNHI